MTPKTPIDTVEQILAELVERCRGIVLEQWQGQIYKNPAFDTAKQALDAHYKEKYTRLLPEKKVETIAPTRETWGSYDYGWRVGFNSAIDQAKTNFKKG